MSVDFSHQHLSRGALSSATRAPSSSERVVVVGGGFAGRSAVRLLSSVANKRNAFSLHITLIDRAPLFEFTPGVLRCIGDPTRLDEIIAPHAVAIEPCATFVHGCVTDIQDGHITFVSPLPSAPQTLHFDYCVWATGSSYTFPIDSHPGTLVLDLAERRTQLKRLQKQLMSSKLVSIVGGGPVGVELAAELACMRKARLLQKGCKVKLHTREGFGGVLAGFTPAARNYTAKWLRKAGVEVTTALPDSDSLCIRCTGNIPSTPEPCFKHFHTWTSSVVRVEGLSAIDAMAAGRKAAQDVLSMAQTRLRSQSNEKRGTFIVRRITSDVKVAVVSLGDHDAILCAGPLTLTGVLPALLKRFVQVINVRGARGNVFAAWAARQSSALALWLGRLATRMERAAHRQSIARSHS